MINYFDKVVIKTENLLLLISLILLFIMMLIITFSVIGRSFFNHPFAWSVEFSEYILLYITLLSAPWILRNGAHVKLEMFVDMLPNKTKNVIYVLTLLLSAFACFILSIFSFEYMIDHYIKETVMYKLVQLPKYILYIPIFVGSFVLLLRFIILIGENLLHQIENI